MGKIEIIYNVSRIMMLIVSTLGVFFDILLLIIYSKYTTRGHLTQYKIVLLILCLLDSLCNLSIDASFFDSLRIICDITGTLKMPIGIGLETTQVSLILITYFSFTHFNFIDKHSMLFKIIIFIQCFLPVLLTTIQEFYYYFTIEKIARSMYCLKDDFSFSYCFIISLLICYIVFITFLIKLYRSLNIYRNSLTRQNNRLEVYKSHIMNFLFGLFFTFPEIIVFLYFIFMIAIEHFSFLKPTLGYMTIINTFIDILFFVNNGLSPIFIAIIYCFSKEHFKFIKEIFCCSNVGELEEDNSINITQETASLFDGSVVTIDNDSVVLLERKNIN